ncbi:hypothetical protein DB347_13160 [Opitutaceae bacterium EW11]|nr:hypothetical protein DB347_13160 [Opitutaceae bacterium EW11]
MTVVAPSREKLLLVAQQLPASPQVLVHLSELLTDVNSGLDDVAVLLRRDTALAARVIRISNSVAFGMCGRVETVEDAVNRVGYAEIYRLVGLATAAQMAELNLSVYGITGPQLRDNTLVVALAVEALATRAGADSRVAYTAGLLRSTGKLVLDRYARKTNLSCESLTASGMGHLLNWEQATFGCTNIEVAQWVLSGWRFPRSIVEPICHQYSAAMELPDHAQTGTFLRLACTIAHDAGFGLFGERDLPETTSAALLAAGLTPSQVEESAEEAKASFEALRSSL